MSDNQSPKALNDLGDKYFYGQETTRNIELAFTYYKQAADQGNPVGLYNVGKYFFAKDEFKKAVEYLQKALLSGYSKAYLMLANMSLEGKGMHKSKKKAFKYTMDGANLGDTDAYNQLARYYQKGIGCSKDEKLTRKYYQLSADKNNREGMYQLGLIELDSPKGKKNPEAALHWFDKASEMGSQEAIQTVISLYTAPHPYFKKRSQAFLKEMIFFYTELLARNGDVPALEKVASDYLEGTDVTKKNPEKASDYFRMLLALDNTIGYYGSGICHLLGCGAAKDGKVAIERLKIAAERGYEKAMTKLGDIYRNGILTDPDPEEAKKWYYEAAKQNAPEALVNLGLLHYRADIANSSPELAFQYIESAVKKGNPQAYYWMGIFREKGVGCDVDLIQAEKFYQKAISEGIIAATYKYGVLLFETAKKQKQKRKASQQYLQARDQFIQYVGYPQKATANAAFSCYFLGQQYQNGLGVTKSERRARFWFETGAESGYSKAMIEMYRILRDKEIQPAINWLKKADEESEDSEAMYELGLLYLNEEYGIDKDLNKAKYYLERSARLNYKPALDRLMML